MKKIKNYIQDQTFKMIVQEESIYINQFKKIILLEENHVIIKTKNKKIHIYGIKLKLQKLVNYELLLKGQLEKVEVQQDG